MSCPIIPEGVDDCIDVVGIPDECYPEDGPNSLLYYYDDPIVYGQPGLVYLAGPLPPKV